VKYADWVETVVRTTVEAFDAGSGFSTNEAAVVEKLGLDLGEDHREPVWDAFRDLERMGLLESASRWDIKNGRLSAQNIGRDWRLEESEAERYRADPSIAGPTGRWGSVASFRAECLAKKPYGAKALALVTCEEFASLDCVHYRERLEVG
jgi:hypothetical protein